jgi:hypothetical protein
MISGRAEFLAAGLALSTMSGDLALAEALRSLRAEPGHSRTRHSAGAVRGGSGPRTRRHRLCRLPAGPVCVSAIRISKLPADCSRRTRRRPRRRLAASRCGKRARLSHNGGMVPGRCGRGPRHNPCWSTATRRRAGSGRGRRGHAGEGGGRRPLPLPWRPGGAGITQSRAQSRNPRHRRTRRSTRRRGYGAGLGRWLCADHYQRIAAPGLMRSLAGTSYALPPSACRPS